MKINMPIIAGLMWWVFTFSAGTTQLLVQNKYFAETGGEPTATVVWGCTVEKLAYGKGYAFVQLDSACDKETRVIFRYQLKSNAK